MNSRFTLAFLLFCVPFAVFAQCPGTAITLSTQQEVDDFPDDYPGCTDPQFTITITGANITNLNGLNAITSTGHSFFIIDNPALTSLSGLSNLTTIDLELKIVDNPSLTSLGLTSLTTLGGHILLDNNDALTSLSGLSALSGSMGSYLFIGGNASLTNLSGLGPITSIGGFVNITGNGNLTSINGLNSVTSVGAVVPGSYFSITSNSAMTSINGFNALTIIDGDFEISGNNTLANLNGFSNLATVEGTLSFDNNGALTSVSSLSDLTTVNGNFFLVGNGLTSLTGLNTITTIGQTLEIFNNDALPSLTAGFNNLTSIGGLLAIQFNNILSNCTAEGICDFVETIPGDATISGNANGCNSVAQVVAACAPAPVELVTFSAKEDSEGAMLLWQTATELNNDYFQVEHSLNGVKFEPIGAVAGNGTSQSLHNYHFLHRQPPAGMNYYRLKQVDLDGQFSYSNIATLRLQGAALEVFPNPTTGYVAIWGDFQEGSARITDINGKLIREQNFAEGNSFNISDHPDGVYFVEIQTNNQKTVKRIIKKTE